MNPVDESLDAIVIHVELLGEGTRVYRPTRGRLVRDGVYELLPSPDHDVAVEIWAFPPGSLVEVEVRRLAGGDAVVAARLSGDPATQRGMLEGAVTVPWAAFARPVGDPLRTDPVEVLTTLLLASTAGEATQARDAAMDVVGHDHSGTVYPAAVPMAPYLLRLGLDAPSPWARMAALDVLADLVTSFQPDEALAAVTGADGRAAPLMEAIRDAIRPGTERLLDLVADPVAYEELRVDALDILEGLGGLERRVVSQFHAAQTAVPERSLKREPAGEWFSRRRDEWLSGAGPTGRERRSGP